MSTTSSSEHATKCQLCDENESQWKCVDCSELICDWCKRSHLKSKASRDHQVLPVGGAEDHAALSGSTKMCDLHPSERLQMYCEQCNMLICRDCLIDKLHQTHSLCKLEDVMERKQKELFEVTEKVKLKLDSYKDAIGSINDNIAEYTESITQQKSKIKERNEDLKRKADCVYEDLLKKMHKREVEDLGKLKQTQKGKEETVIALQGLYRRCEESQAENLKQIIKSVENLKNEAEKYAVCCAVDTKVPPKFVVREENEHDLSDVFGCLEVEEENVSDFEHAPSPAEHTDLISRFHYQATFMATLDESCAYVVTTSQKNISLVTFEGGVVKTYRTDFKIYDLAVTNNGSLFVTLDESKKIKTFLRGRFVDFYIAPVGNTLAGISSTENNSLIVCSLNNDMNYDNKLIELSLQGEIMNTIQHDADSNTPLFCNPRAVSSNRNGDIIVAQPGHGVIAVDRTGRRKFLYKGQELSTEKPFCPVYTTTDKYGQILVSDIDNSAIYLLSMDGTFLKLLLTQDDGIKSPGGLSVDVLGRLWVCNIGNAEIMVMKYISF